jgi:hypothetical protein
MLRHALRGTGARTPGTKVSVMQPSTTRIGVIMPGANDRKAMAMK